MANYAYIQSKIDHGKGIAARHLGQPFMAYRIEEGSSGDFPTGWTVVNASFPIFRRKFVSTAKSESGLERGVQWFDIVANMDAFLLGDVFIQIDPDYVSGVSYGPGATLLYDTLQFEGMGLAVHMPVGKSIGGRLDRRVMITRPNMAPATLGDGSKFFKTTFDDDLPLVLTSGQFGFGSPGAPGSWVPAGFSAYTRPTGADLFRPDVPAMTKPGRYYVYVPPLPGWSPTEGDALICEDGSRYRVELPFYQEAGLVGSQLVVERLTRQNA